MNILNFHDKLIKNYRSYIQSFVKIKDPRIADFVDSKIRDNELWPEPLIQFNPTFAVGASVQSLVEEKILHPSISKIFNHPLYKHQEEAIRIGASGKEFIVTSGTGSGKSLTYLATIFNHILKTGAKADKRTLAVIVYPMNALINSQFKALNDYKTAFEKDGSVFPITFGQYTGQENEQIREEMRKKPPQILLTNYMMLELIMTRAGKDIDLRNNILDNIEYLVFDELHTYRGRQGADVAMLIRRIQSESKLAIKCIGTSATMVSNDTSSLQEQKQEVARVGSQIFGKDIKSDQVVYEYLIKSIKAGVAQDSNSLVEAIKNGIDVNAPSSVFESHPTANWLEENVALEVKEDVTTRRKPTTINNVVEKLIQETALERIHCERHLHDLLHWANLLNSDPNKKDKQNFLPYRIHQFIAQTGSVYGTLGDQASRELSMDAGRYDPKSKNFIFPLVFSRTSGHEFYCVELDLSRQIINPRDFTSTADKEDQENDNITSGYIFINHTEDGEPLWDFNRDKEDLPEGWFNPPRKDGTSSIKKDKADRIPRKVHFDSHGNFSYDFPLEYEGWYMPSPLLFDPTSGHFYDHMTAEWTKLMKLGGEGRSTATTVLSYETITQMFAFNEPTQNQKLLSFTDNRQDASLQAGHFNDFIKVGQLRSSIVKALEGGIPLDYSNIGDAVLNSLNLDQEQFAKNPATFPGPRKENEEAFKDYILYKLIEDLRRSWRVVLPNLEQCALLEIGYSYLESAAEKDELWDENPLLRLMTAEGRVEFLTQIFDFLRKSYALSFSKLEYGAITQNSNRIKEKLKDPWTLENAEKIEVPSFLRIETLARQSHNFYSESGGPQSVLGRYIKRIAKEYGVDLKGKDNYIHFTYQLMDLLTTGGWLKCNYYKSTNQENVQVYQLKVDSILWMKGNGRYIRPDRIKSRSYREIDLKPNEYFQKFYGTNFQALKPIDGKEHTGQINTLIRREREDKFRKGEISALFCSPTMELGIDISELSIVHMRNVPPSPANYAQRSGRAGRSGQAALVMVYCSNFSSHDRHFFKYPSRMVAGTVTAPRMDLINEELLRSHLFAVILTKQPLDGLRESLGDIIDTENINILPLKEGVIEALQLSDKKKKDVSLSFTKLMNDTYFTKELERRKPFWFDAEWINRSINSYAKEFDKSLDRWRDLYRNAINQFREANSIIENVIYADNHKDKIEAKSRRRQAERQMDVLLSTKDFNSNLTSALSEFYPYRYLASEGFLPGYGFTRLPIRSFMENRAGTGDFVSRPRLISLGEFGPRNVIYHDGAKYRIDRMIFTESETRLERAKVSPYSGYILMRDQYNYTVDPVTEKELNEGMDKHYHSNLIEMSETKATELQRITCQEEERSRRGYDIKTFFSVDGDFDSLVQAKVNLSEEKLIHIHSLPAARLVHVNFKWKGTTEDGFAINLKNGFWQNNEPDNLEELGDDFKRVKLYTTTTSNAIYLQPIPSLGLEGGKDGVITLMYTLKKAIENYFQVESNEVGVAVMGESDVPNILLYESSEGSLGILSQIVESPDVYRQVIAEAFNLCFIKNGKEIPKEELLPATYDDLLSYYNQHHHANINRNHIRESLRMLQNSSIEVLTSKRYESYDDHYKTLEASRDQTSATEAKFLKFLYDKKLKLPDEAQPNISNLYVRPDFFYKHNVCIFCDGTPHDGDSVIKDDNLKRETLKNSGYQVLSWHYKEDLQEFVEKRPDIFRKVK